MATLVVRRRKDGSRAYRVQWNLGGARGAPWQSETFDSRPAAVKFAAQVEAAGHRWPEGWVKGVGYVTAAPESEQGHPFVEYATAYVRRLTSVGPDTQTRYGRQVEALAGWLREIRAAEPVLEEITPDDDRDWINLLRRRGVSPKTIANYHGLLAAIFKSAVVQGLIPRSPCDGVKLPPVDDDIDDDEDKVFLTEPEFFVVRSAMAADSQDLVLVAVGTGLRWGELTALKAKDLSLDTTPATLAVRRAWKRNGRGEFALANQGRFYLGKPKTRESRRRMTLAPQVVAALRRASDGRAPDDLLFVSPRGERLDQANWYESRWQRAVRAAQAQGLTKSPRFHDLRHSHAAWLISAGVPLPVIQKRLGHKSIQITVDVYGGLLFQTHEVADLAIERALGGESVVKLIEATQAAAEAGELLVDESA